MQDNKNSQANPGFNLSEGVIWAVDKPLGWSSFHVVKKLRGALLSRVRHAGVKKLKVGHAGTLDPLASGVMIICLGKATKEIDSLQSGAKEYIAEITLGATTPSFDLETPVDATYPTAHITRELIDEVIPRFIGTIQQIPPVYSACKVEGRRAYKAARSGEAVELKPKTLVIDRIEVDSFDCSSMKLTIRVVCSKGTYIRALARDIGEALGSGAHLSALRRTRVGDYSLSVTKSIDKAVQDIYRSTIVIPRDGEDPVIIPAASELPESLTGGISRTDSRDILSYAERIKKLKD